MLTHSNEFENASKQLDSLKKLGIEYSESINEFSQSRIDIEEAYIEFYQQNTEKAEELIRKGLPIYKKFSDDIKYIPNLDCIFIAILIKNKKYEEALAFLENYPTPLAFEKTISHFYAIILFYQKALLYKHFGKIDDFQKTILIFMDHMKKFYVFFEKNKSTELPSDFFDCNENNPTELLQKAHKILEIFQKIIFI